MTEIRQLVASSAFSDLDRHFAAFIEAQAGGEQPSGRTWRQPWSAANGVKAISAWTSKRLPARLSRSCPPMV